MKYDLVLLGDPVEHSRSPAIHRAALAACGLRGSYVSRQVDEEGVRAAFAELRSGALHGLNVTMPYKMLAATLCDRLDGPAERAGSVNTAFCSDGVVWGMSTDIGGIRDLFTRFRSAGPVLILGAGGAAASACVALEGHPLYLAARRPGKGLEMSERLRLDMGEVGWGVPVVGAVVVNCTPLGMSSEELPGPVLALASGIFDMAYGEGITPAVEYLRKRGEPTVTGLELLLAQAARSFTAWTGLEAPVAAMRTALGNP